MEEQWQFFLIDGWIILVGALLVFYAVIQLLIDFKVKNSDVIRSYSWNKVAKHLILLFLGVALIITRVIYMVDHNNWYDF